jgi:tetratricopeptide (TPR) repeat protein
MATHPDDPNVHQPGDEPAAKPDEGQPSKHTKLPRQPGKPTMLQPDTEKEGAQPAVPNMSLDRPGEKTDMIGEQDIPELEAVPESDATEAIPASDVADMLPVEEAEPVSEIHHAEAVFDELEALPISDVAEAQPISDAGHPHRPIDVTGADVPVGAEQVLEEVPGHAESAKAGTGSSDVLGPPPDSGAEAVLGNEPLDRGSRPSARVESPIRAEPDDDAVNLGGPPGPGGKKPTRAQMDGTEEVLAGEPTGRGSSAINWNEIGEDSGARVKPVEDETVPFDAIGEGSSNDSLLNAEDLAKHADDGSAVDLGEMPPKSKSPSGIDAVAEALESGVSIEDEVPLSPKPTPSVEFDDILTDSAESLPPVKKGNGKKGAEDDVESQEPTDDNLEAVGRAKKKKKKDDADDEAAALFTEDEAEAVAVPAEDEAAAIPVDDDEAVAAPIGAEDTDLEPASKKDEGTPSKGRGKAAAAPAPVRGSGCMGWVVGSALGILIGAAGTYGALSFLAPAPAPVAKVGPIVPPQPQAEPSLTPVQKAYPALAAGNYAQVIEDLKDEADPAAVAVRGEAKWLKYAKAKLDAKEPLKESDPDVQDALKDLGKDSTRGKEVLQIARETETQTQLAQARQSVDTLNKNLAKAEADRKQADALMKDIGGALVSAKIIANAGQVSPDSVRKLIKALGDNQAALAGVNKILQNANVKDGGAQGVAELLAAKKNADDKLTEVDKALAQAKVKDAGAKGVQALVAARAQAQKDRDELNAAIKAAYDEMVKANVVKPGSDPRKALVEGAKAARERGESPLTQPLMYLGSTLASMAQGVGQLVARGVDTTAMATDLALWEGRGRFMQTPVQNLDLYAALLQDRSVANAKQLQAIRSEVDWVLTRDAKVTPTDRAKALYVSGLALRNERKFDAARKALGGAVKHEGAKNAAWQKQAEAALAELTNPQAYYLPQIERLQATGDIKAAITETDRALQAMPGDGTLLAERGLLRLESVRAKGKLSAAEQQQIRKDAEAAIKAPGGSAEGAYVLGRLEEQLGQYAKAEAHYRDAIRAHKGDDAALVRYRVALAHVLLQTRPAAAAPAPADDKKGADTATSAAQPTSVMHPVTALVLTAVIGAQNGDAVEKEDPAAAKRLREAIDLAKTLATSKDAKVKAEGYDLLGKAVTAAGGQLTSATCLELARGLIDESDPKVRGSGMMLKGLGLAKKGEHSDGLREYSRGLALLNPDLALGTMVEKHPAFRHPFSESTPNPLLAEKHFGNGLHLYWKRRYPEAEEEFRQALAYFSQDARYAYWMGLAQLAQKTRSKREQAYFSFEQGARLEAQERPTIGEINASLERIQGDVRRLLNSYRFRETATAAP